MSRMKTPLRLGFLLPASALTVAVGAGLMAAQPATLPAPVAAGLESITANDLKAYISFLASDALQGRGLGHAGNDVAVQFLAATLQAHDVPAIDSTGYLRAIDLTTPSLGSRNSLRVEERGNGDVVVANSYDAGPDFQPADVSASREVTAPLAFAGYGIRAPELGRDDYATLDVKGRVVIVFTGTPEKGGDSDPYRTTLVEHGAIETKSATAAERGAVGLLLVAPSGDRRLPDVKRAWPDTPSVRQMRFDLAHDQTPIPVGRISGTVAEALLRRGDSKSPSLDELRRAQGEPAKAGEPARFALPDRTRVTLRVDVRRTNVRGYNVVGWIEGGDPKLKQEVVVIGAHLDHDGIDADGRIYNGADDNASGSAGVLEVAEAFARAAAAGATPKRSVVFALWNGEERGELGARAFAERPARDGWRYVTNLNMDMIGRDEEIPEGDRRFSGLRPTRPGENTTSVHVLGYSRSPELAAIAREQNAGTGLALLADLDDNQQNLIRRSDQWPFLQRRVPALFFFTGLHPDYHTPQDDADKLNYGKMEKIVRLTYRVAWHVANMPAPPAFVDPRPESTQ